MTGSRVWRRLLAVLLALAAVALLGVALPQGASGASALPVLPDCKEAPTPEVPGRGVEAFFQPTPAAAPAQADPFAPDATTTIYEQYGYAGLRWSTYDLGCASNAASPEASVGTTVANWLFTLPKAVVAATGALLTAAYEPTFLGVLDPLVASVTDALRRSVFDQWAGLVVAGVGFLIVWRARRSSLRGTAAALGWALLVMVVASVLFRWPVVAGKAADSTVTGTMSAVTSALDQHDAQGRTSTGALAAGNLHDALLYQVWLGGEFGDANSVTARKYGPQLFRAQALTWSEAATLSQDPAQGQAIMDRKKADFERIAAAVKAEDPDAYEYLSGRRSDARVGFAALSVLAVACAVPFLLMAALLVVGALVVMRFAVMLFPAIATLGLFPSMRSLVTGVGNTVAAAVLNALVFGISSAVLVKAYSVVMAPGNGLPSWLVVTLVLLLTLVMWFALRPFRRLTALASPGRNHFGDAAGALGSVTRGLGRASGKVATTALGVVIGEGAAERRREHDEDDSTATRDLRRVEATDGGEPEPATSGGSRQAQPEPTPAAPVEADRGGGWRRVLGGGGGPRQPARGEELVAAEPGLPSRRASRDLPAPPPVSAPVPAPVAAADPVVPQSRRPLRRSEGEDLDDLPGWLRPARPAAREAVDPYADDDGPVYRPGGSTRRGPGDGRA